MAKKIIRLTESELNQIIKEATAKIMNEMDAATYSRIHNASHRAMQDIQNGNYERTINGRDFVDNDEIISRADSMEQNVQAHWLKDYIGQTFKFFGRSQMGLPAHVIFTFERITKLEPNKTVLVDFTKGRVKYHERGNRYAYTLEIDNRYKPLWDKL